MTPYLSVPTTKSAFDAFLFAPVGEEANGMTLSVLSALSRLGVDPWEEAVRLSLLSKERAAVALERNISCLPLGAWQVSDTGEIAKRLVALLPTPADRAAVRSPASQADHRKLATIALWLVAAGIAICLTFDLPARVGRLLDADGFAAPLVTTVPRSSSQP